METGDLLEGSRQYGTFPSERLTAEDQKAPHLSPLLGIREAFEGNSLRSRATIVLCALVGLCGATAIALGSGKYDGSFGHQSLLQTPAGLDPLSISHLRSDRLQSTISSVSSATSLRSSQKDTKHVAERLQRGIWTKYKGEEAESGLKKRVVASLYIENGKYDVSSRNIVSSISSIGSSSPKTDERPLPRVVYGVKDEQAAAYGVFDDSLHKVGWSKLWLKGTANGNEASQSYLERSLTSAYAAGYLEGALTHHRIHQHFFNTYFSFFPTGKASKEVEAFARANLKYIQDQVRMYGSEDMSGASSKDVEARYWRTVGLTLAQFDGLVAGYQAMAPPEASLSSLDLYILNLDGDLEDLIPALAEKKRTMEESSAAFQLRAIRTTVDASKVPYHEYIKGFRCSALVRITPDFQDVVWGHTTWDQFSAMVRILKSYDMPVSGGANLEGKILSDRRKVSFSSSPGYLASVDDFYLTDSGLAVTETTNGVYNESLYSLISPSTLPSWMRANVASFLSVSGTEWAENFGRSNSGTYNNQWMIVDTHRFIPGKGFAKGGFTVLEQMPGRVIYEDMSEHINNKGYWASYNLPYFEEIYKKSGFLDMYARSNYSDAWSYDRAPRAKIFKRDAPTVSSYEDMKHIIRYNQWEEDPLSNGHPGNAIASRFDLESPGRSLFGGVDAKVTSLQRALRMEMEAVNGPTTQQPVFRWSEHDRIARTVPHEGHPEIFNFSFVSMGPLASDFLEERE